MSTEWDHEFQRLENGEVAHIATAELLNWQMRALVEEEPQYIEAQHIFKSSSGSMHISRDFMAAEPDEITQSIELFDAPKKGGACTSLVKLIYSPEGILLPFVNQDLDDPLSDIFSVLDGVRVLKDITPQEAGFLDDLEVLFEAVVLIDDDEQPDDLIYDVGRCLAETINRRAVVHSINSKYNFSNAEQSVKLTQERYIDMSFGLPQLCEGQGEFELVVTNKTTQSAITMTGGYAQEILTTDAYDPQLGTDIYRLATVREQQDMVIMLAELLRPTLLNRSPEWLSQYSHQLGWSIHHEGIDTSNAIVLGKVLHRVRSMFVGRLEAINHFIPGYTNRNLLDDIELYLADHDCHPNGFAVTADELVDSNNMPVERLDGTKTRTAIYLGTRFLEPHVELQNIDADYGAYLDVILAVEETTPEDNPMRIGSIALNQCEMVESDKTFN